MTAACMSWATEMPEGARRGRPHGVAGVALCGAILLAAAGVLLAAPATTPPAPPVPSAAPKRLGPGDLRAQFEKAEKSLHKAGKALDGHDAGRVSLLLKRADDEIGRFEDGSGLAVYVASVKAARDAADRNDLAAAGDALKRAKAAVASLTDYTVPRAAEVAYRSAMGAVEEKNTDDFLASLGHMEGATRAPVLLARLGDARAALARARTMMVRNDFKGGRKEVAAAGAALDTIVYAGTLSRSSFGLLAGSELLGERSFLAARDQVQKGLKNLSRALEIAPQADREDLDWARGEAVTVWQRINHPEADDPGRLEAASQRLETVRQRLK
jgi:hypothetical protein